MPNRPRLLALLYKMPLPLEPGSSPLRELTLARPGGRLLTGLQHVCEGSPCHQGHSTQVCEAVRAVAREALPWDREIPVFRDRRSTKRRGLWILHQQTEVEV